jgi:C1A family cysteine protease
MMYKYNHRSDEKDERDKLFHFYASQKTSAPIPPLINLRDRYPLPVLDQGDLGSSTVCAASNALRFCLQKEDTIVFQPSRLFIYYFSRLLEGNVNEDSGAAIRDVLRSITAFGACSETSLPYDIDKFSDKPPTKCITSAKRHISKFQYLRVTQDILSLKTALASGYPVLCGIQVYDSFESDQCLRSGIVPIPDVQNEKLLGAHCVLLVGYNDSTKCFILQNSWGVSVGQGGFFKIPYQYIVDSQLSNDFWAIDYFV